MSAKILCAVLGLAAVQAAPAADSEADTQFFGMPAMPGMHPMAAHPLSADPVMGGALPVAEAYPIESSGHPHYPFGPLPSNCKVEHETLMVNQCQPTIERQCQMQTVDTEEIEYEKLCKNVVETICNNMPLGGLIVKRDADVIVDDALFGSSFVQPHTSVTKVKSTCQEVTTEHCFNNPKVKQVPVEVETCHPVTKANCREVEQRIPKTVCEPIETTIRSNPGFPSRK